MEACGLPKVIPLICYGFTVYSIYVGKHIYQQYSCNISHYKHGKNPYLQVQSSQNMPVRCIWYCRNKGEARVWTYSRVVIVVGEKQGWQSSIKPNVKVRQTSLSSVTLQKQRKMMFIPPGYAATLSHKKTQDSGLTSRAAPHNFLLVGTLLTINAH